jgi:predicted dehydrogenase
MTNKMNSMKNKESRRTFVKKSAVLTSAMVLPNLQYAQVFNEKKLKIALVGCGGRGAGAANQALQADDNVELIAMADIFEDRLEKSYQGLAEEYAGTEKFNVNEKSKFLGFDGYRKAIDMADVVILATPPGFRPYHFAYAIEQGKHVFMEKPVATDAPGVRKVLEMARVAEQKKLNVVVGLQRRYQRNYLEVYDQVRKGAIGKIVAGQVYWNSGGVWVKPRKPEYTELEYQMRNWYYFNWICGDHILEQHIHNIDVANWYIGEYPTTAQGMGGREVRKGPDHGEIFDHHFVEFTYPSGAVIASQCRHQKNTMSRVAEAFQGTKGMINTRDAGKATIRDLEGNPVFAADMEGAVNPYQEEHNRLFASIRNGEVINNAEYGAKSTMTALLGRMATYSGKMVTWDEALNSNVRLMPEIVTWNTVPPTLPDENGLYPVPVPGETEVI